MCDTTADVNSSVSVSTKQTKPCLPSLCPAPILFVPRPLYSHSERQESALPNPQYVVSVGEPAYLLARWARRKSVPAGSTPTMQRDQTRPSYEFIHCSCHKCNVFMNTAGRLSRRTVFSTDGVQMRALSTSVRRFWTLGFNSGSSQTSLTRLAICPAVSHRSGTTAAGALCYTTYTIAVALSEPQGATEEDTQGFETQRCNHVISLCPRELDSCQTHYGHP